MIRNQWYPEESMFNCVATFWRKDILTQGDAHIINMYLMNGCILYLCVFRVMPCAQYCVIYHKFLYHDKLYILYIYILCSPHNEINISFQIWCVLHRVSMCQHLRLFMIQGFRDICKKKCLGLWTGDMYFACFMISSIRQLFNYALCEPILIDSKRHSADRNHNADGAIRMVIYLIVPCFVAHNSAWKPNFRNTSS